MLRTRLNLGLACLLVILLSTGLYSINQCSELGKRIESIARDNDDFGRNIQRMKRSGAEMTGALFARVTSDESKSQTDFAEATAAFEKALADESSRSMASTEEKKQIAKLAEAFKDYEGRARVFLSSPTGKDDAWRGTAHQLGQNTSELLDMVDALAAAHEEGVNSGRRDTHGDIVGTIRSLIFLMIVATIVAIYASMRLTSGLLNPLTTLTSSIRKIGEGNLDQTVPVLSRDELGVLAITFNQMAAQLRQYKLSTSGELTRLTMTIRATLASFPDPIFVLNSKGAVEFRNPEADQLAMKLLFSGVTRLPEQVDLKVEEVKASGHDYLPTLFRDAIKFHLDGQDKYFLPRIVLLRNDLKEIFGVAVILENVTRMLLLDDVKSNLIATVSHELKTPLTSVRMALYLLHEKNIGPLNAKQDDLVLTAREDTDRLLKTLNDLLDLARLEQGQQSTEFTAVAPAELVNNAVREMRDIADAAQITIRTNVAPNLPTVRVDLQRMDYVLTNLITNAIKYSAKGSEIVVGVESAENRSGQAVARFYVRDQGQGISHEHQAHIFERFYRVPGTTKSGAGLGLSIAREIVILHRGDIGVLSQPGKGSEFFFVIPVKLEETPAPSV